MFFYYCLLHLIRLILTHLSLVLSESAIALRVETRGAAAIRSAIAPTDGPSIHCGGTR